MRRNMSSVLVVIAGVILAVDVAIRLVPQEAMAQQSLQTIPNVVQAKNFQVVDDDGRVLVHIGTSDESSGGRLVLYNTKQRSAVILRVSEHGGWVGVANRKGKTVACISTIRDSSGFFAYSPTVENAMMSTALVAGPSSAWLEMTRNNVAAIEIIATAAPRNGNGITLNSTEGDVRAGMGVSNNSGLVMVVGSDGVAESTLKPRK